jgi:hypothetical protein
MKCGYLITAIGNSVTSLRIRIGNGLRENVRIPWLFDGEALGTRLAKGELPRQIRGKKSEWNGKAGLV